MSSSPLSPQSSHKQNAPAQFNPVQRLFRAVYQIASPSMNSLFGSNSSSLPHDDDHYENTGVGTHLSHSNSRTRSPFKPQKAGRGTSSWQLKEFAEATLGNGSLRKAVKLPEGEDENEWLAVNGTDRTSAVFSRNVLTSISCRLLQSDQSSIWSNY
jgi:Mob1/phocein family protein